MLWSGRPPTTAIEPPTSRNCPRFSTMPSASSASQPVCRGLIFLSWPPQCRCRQRSRDSAADSARKHRAGVQGGVGGRQSKRTPIPSPSYRRQRCARSRQADREGELDILTPQSGLGGAGPGVKIDRSYSNLVSRTIGAADNRVERADVGGIEKLVASVLKTTVVSDGGARR